MLPISMASQDNQFHIFHWHFIEISHSNFPSYSHGIFLLLFFFSLIILIATSFLLAHLCHRQGSAAAPACPTAILHWGELEMEAMGNKSAVGDTNVECSICLSVLKEGGKVKVLPECEHAYHSECVEMWLSANPTCPLCRASLHKFMSNNTVININNV